MENDRRPRVVVCDHGRPASVALAEAVSRAKNGRPLDPVTVVVPSNFAGLSVRRLLGGGELGHGGVAAVSLVTPLRFAELLAGPDPDGLLPLTNPVLRAAVRAALRSDPGPFAGVATHHATEQAVASLYAEVSSLSPSALTGLRSDRSRGVIAVCDAVAARLAGHADESRVVARAVTRLADPTTPADVGSVIWFLPEPAGATVARLFAAVVARGCSVIVGRTGDAEADGPVVAMCARAGLDLGDEMEAGVAPLASRIVSVTDADEECREVTRSIVRLLADGVPAHRIGIVAPAPDPYLRLLRHHLDAAGVPANGPAPTRLGDGVVARSVVAALSLDDADWRRSAVGDLLAGAPLRSGDRLVPASWWEDLSRRAGVVRGRRKWRRHLDDFAHDLRWRAARPGVGDGLRARLESDADEAGVLAAHLEELGESLDAVERARSWTDKVEAVRALVTWLFGPSGRWSDWPEAEVASAERLDAALDRLAALDPIDPEPDSDAFRRALLNELDVARDRDGRFGHGVTYGPLSGVVGADLDAVFVVGMSEGLCPAGRSEDPLLPDSARAATDGELRLRRDGRADQKRHLLAALAAAPEHARVLCVPRGDLRNGGHPLPSRWVLPSATVLAGAPTPVRSTEFDDLRAPAVDVLGSFASGLRAGPDAASIAERDLATVRAWVAAGGVPDAHPAAAVAGSGFASARARSSTRFTEFDGNLAGADIPLPTDGAVVSPTGLETWANCGFRYFLGHVLGVQARVDPEDVVEVSALDRGSVLHDVLETFLQEVIGLGAPDPGTAWSTDQRNRLAETADAVFTRLERTGRVGRELIWNLERARLHRVLQRVLDVDETLRARFAMTPIETEVGFGFDDDALDVALPSGRSLRFRGRVDRIDRTADGGLRVSDYKSGKGKKYAKLGEDPVSAGTLLQLGVYAELARRRGDGPVATGYWMLEPGSEPWLGYEWTTDNRSRFLEVLDAIVDGIEAGLFDAVPGEWDTFRQTNKACAYCDFDSVCPRDRGEHAEAKAGDAAVRLRTRLGAAVDDEADDGD